MRAEAGKFSPWQAGVADAIKKAFKIDLEPDSATNAKARDGRTQRAFFLCYRALEKLSDIPQVFDAQYGLFLTLLTVFLLLFVAGIIAWLAGAKTSPGAIGSAILIGAFGVMVCYRQVRASGDDFARAVYDGVVVHNATVTKEAQG